MSCKYKLTYFNVKGRCENIRYIFAAAQVPFEDVRITNEQWQDIKTNTPFGQIPILEVDGKVIAQSSVIARYVAREVGLAGNSSLDAALVDSIAETAIEIREKYIIPNYFEEDEDKQKELWKTFAEKIQPEYLSNFSKLLGDQDYFINNQLTYADLTVVYILDMMEGELGEVLDRFPTLRSLQKRVREIPALHKYITERPETDY